MSYIKVNLGGQERGLKFNQLAVEVFAKNINLEAVQISSVYAMFYAGLIGNCVAKKVDQDFTFEQVTEWVDELFENDPDKIKAVDACFSETQFYKNLITSIKDNVEQPEQEKKS